MFRVEGSEGALARGRIKGFSSHVAVFGAQVFKMLRFRFVGAASFCGLWA